MTIHLGMVIWILILHYLGDWVFQTRDQARNKHLIGVDMFWHVFNYTITLMVGMMCAFAPEMNKNEPIWLTIIIGWPILNGIAHFTVDAITSNQTKQYWFDGKPSKGFWLWIGADQILHYAILFVTYILMVRN